MSDTNFDQTHDVGGISFSPAVFPPLPYKVGSERKTRTSKPRESRRATTVEAISHTRRITQIGDRQVILPPNGTRNRYEWGS